MSSTEVDNSIFFDNDTDNEKQSKSIEPKRKKKLNYTSKNIHGKNVYLNMMKYVKVIGTIK